MGRLTILYGTQTGNAERLALRVARYALKRGASEVCCLPADTVPVTEWVTLNTPLILVCSNANQGEAPDTFRSTWASLLATTCPKLDGVSYAVFGLGDSMYPKFNYMAKMIHNRLKQLGAAPLVVRGLGDESDARGLDETLLPWLVEVWTALGWMTPEAAAAEPQERPLDCPLFPLYTVEPFIEAGACDADAVPVLGRMTSNSSSSTSPASTSSSLPPYPEPVFPCEVTANRRLTAPDYTQAVHHLELRAEKADFNYDVGDALGVYCVNRDELVDEFLQRVGRSGEEAVLVRPCTSHGLVRHASRAFFDRPMTVRYLVQHYFDLEAVVTQELFWMLAHFVPTSSGATSNQRSDKEEEEEEAIELRERLLEFANPVNVDEYLRYAHREKRNVCEVLHDFRTLHPSLELLLTFTCVMRPRYFSFASAPALDPLPTFHLTVGRLDWTTPLGRKRSGMCSSRLVEAAVGTRLVACVWQGMLCFPPTPAPLLCVATGTGIAPIRAVLRQCAGLAAMRPAPIEYRGWAGAQIHLFFGCRYAAKDYLYHEEWQELRQRGLLSQLVVHPAFSRDTDKKIYVQHVIGGCAKLVGALLAPEAQSTVLVCGNAKQMPKDVQSTLDAIVEAVTCGNDAEQARAVMRQMTREGRFQMDTWSA